MKKHKTVKEFVCGICGFQTYYKQNMKRHKWIHSNVNQMKCDKCDFSTNSIQYMGKHQKRHLSYNIKCSQCSAKFDCKLLLHMHLKSSHDGPRFKCDEIFCNYVTEIKYNFKIHQRSHTKPYQCDICDKHFATKSRISIHISHKHSTSDRKICVQPLIKSDQLEAHQEAKPFQCDICVKRFALKAQMIVHRSIKHQSESGK